MKKIMNSLFVIALSIAVVSCSDEKSTERILNNPEQQDEVLTAIANDSSMLSKLHQKMRKDNRNMNGGSPMMRSCMAMMDDPEMMSRMMDNMMMRCEQDTAMGSMMCEKMMRSDKMMGMMQDRMHKDMKMDKGSR